MITFGSNAPTWLSLGWIIALIVLIVIIVLMAISSIDLKIGALLAGLAVARLL